jgi:hypothetical protein
MDISCWVALYNKYAHRYSASEKYRKFVSFAGVIPQVAETIFLKYATIGKNSPLEDRLRLFILLHFLKNDPTEDRGATIFRITRNTYRKRLWSSIYYLHFVMEEISIESRFLPFVPRSGIFEGVTIIVDATECPIDRYIHSLHDCSVMNIHT